MTKPREERQNYLFRPPLDRFKNYDDIVDHCYNAWNQLTDQPRTIMSIGLRDWAPNDQSQ